MAPQTRLSKRCERLRRVFLAILRVFNRKYGRKNISNNAGAVEAQDSAVNTLATPVNGPIPYGSGATVDERAQAIECMRKIVENLKDLVDEDDVVEIVEAAGKKEWRKEEYLGGLSPRRKGPRSELITHPETLPDGKNQAKNISQTATQAGDASGGEDDGATTLPNNGGKSSSRIVLFTIHTYLVRDSCGQCNEGIPCGPRRSTGRHPP